MNSVNEIKNIIVTGSNRGLGWKLVDSILNLSQNQVQPNHNIIMTARDKIKGQKEYENLKKQYPSASLFFYQLDVTSLESIEQFFQDYLRDFKKVDILINNAGVYIQGDILNTQYQSIEDIDYTLNVNFYGLINLSEKFLPLLTSNGKIIQVSSDHGLLKNQTEKGRKLLNDKTMTKEKLLLIADEFKLLNITQNNYKYSKCIYQFSKALVNAYNRFILSKLMRDDQLALALTPGFCDTDMGKQGSIDSKRIPINTAQQGVDHILYVTFEIPFIANLKYNGAYFSYNCKEPLSF